jgi:hypothetical protein
MINTSDEKSRAKSAKDSENRTTRRAVQAQIVAGLQTLLEADEQLLGFTRGLIAGGLRGKLTVGFEALFAPYVNIGLTERRVVLQHVQPESGRPNEILPHSFPLSELHSISFSDIETFGEEPAGRLNLRLFNEQHFRLRFSGAENVTNAKTIADVFMSLTSTRPKARTSPTQSLCPHCDQILDRVSKFCPYCGQTITQSEPAAAAAEPTPVDTAVTVEAQPSASQAPPATGKTPRSGGKAQTETSAAEQPADTNSDEQAATDLQAETSPAEGSVSEPEAPTAEHETPSSTDQPAIADAEGDETL